MARRKKRFPKLSADQAHAVLRWLHAIGKVKASDIGDAIRLPPTSQPCHWKILVAPMSVRGRGEQQSDQSAVPIVVCADLTELGVEVPLISTWHE